MDTSLLISLLGAISAIIVSIVGAWLANKNSIILQTRKLREQHYILYLEALHNLAASESDKESVKQYVFARDKLFLIASEEVIREMLTYEEKAVGQESKIHDEYLTKLVKAIRKDLKIKDKDFPEIYLKKANK